MLLTDVLANFDRPLRDTELQALAYHLIAVVLSLHASGKVHGDIRFYFCLIEIDQNL